MEQGRRPDESERDYLMRNSFGLTREIAPLNLTRIAKGVKNVSGHLLASRERKGQPKPTEVDFINQVINEGGMKNFAWFFCSISGSAERYLKSLDDKNEVNFLISVGEHSLPGYSTGAYFACEKGEDLTATHLQNSGLGNLEDGVLFQRVYDVPSFNIVTNRGHDKTDDSEIHQEIGRDTADLMRTIFQGKVFGDRWGHDLAAETAKALEVTKNGGICALRLSPKGFRESFPMKLSPRLENLTLGDYEQIREDYKKNFKEIIEQKGTNSDTNPVKVKGFSQMPTRDQAIDSIINAHPNAAILFCNGYMARAAQANHDRLGNFYNTAYMGGTISIGYGMARLNPNIEVVVVDGDQNWSLGNMDKVLSKNYPSNLNWYVLDNLIGESVGPADSIELPEWAWDIARVIPIKAAQPKSFKSPRVGAHGVYFENDLDDITYMTEKLRAPLPAHAARFKEWVSQQTRRNIASKTNI